MNRRAAATGLLVLVIGAARADDTIDSIEKIAAIRDAAAHHVSAQVSTDSQVEAAKLDSRTRVAACTAPLDTATFGTPANGAWTVTVSCASPAWKLYVPVRVHNMRPVVVLTRNMRAGEAVPIEALAVEQRDTSELSYGYMSDPKLIVGKVLRQSMIAGAAFNPEAIGSAPSIHRGQTVTIRSQAGSIEVRAQGKAMSDGKAGDRISVENDASKRVIDGIVGTDGTVEVSL